MSRGRTSNSYRISGRFHLHLLLLLCAAAIRSQTFPMSTTVDRDTIRIGEQINYTIDIQVDSTDFVFFPKGQTFLPLEVIDTPAVDTTFSDRRIRLRKIYGLSAYDSGNYIVPVQQVSVNRVPYYTDSFRLRVQAVVVDTTQQGLYDIKDVQRVNPAGGGFWDFLPYLLFIILIVFASLWYYLVRSGAGLKRFRRGWEQLSPVERAEQLLGQLRESRLLLENKYKEYYTRTTDVLRNYLEERLGISAPELTTAQLLNLLEVYTREFKDDRVFSFGGERLGELKAVLDRADLVKFAKSSPGSGVAEQDLESVWGLIQSVESEVRELLSEDTLEEEGMNSELELLERRRKKLVNRVLPSFGFALLLLVLAWQVGWLVPEQRKEGQSLQDMEWVRSTYGFPPITIQTPEVLTRYQSRIAEEPDTSIRSINRFDFQLRDGLFSVDLQSVELSDLKSEPQLDQVLEEIYRDMETENQTRNLITKQEEFESANGAKGLKFYGSGEFRIGSSRDFVKGRYAILAFGGPGFYQVIHLKWRLDDPLSEKVAERIMKSIQVSTQL